MLAALFASLHANSAIAATDMIAFDLSRSHVFRGAGVQIWPARQGQAVRDDVLQQLNIRFARISTQMKAPPNALHRGESIAEIVAALHAYGDTAPEAKSYVDLAAELKAMHIGVHGIVWRLPPPLGVEQYWRDAQGRTQTAIRADPAIVNDYANYITAQMLYFRSLGFDLRFVELTNEPDGTWDTLWQPVDYARLVLVTRRVLDTNGLGHVGIEGPGTGTQRAAPPFMAALVATNAAHSLAAISVHDWDSRITPDPEGVTEPFRTEFQRLRLAIPLQVTEFNNENPRWSQRPGMSGPETRDQRRSSADTSSYAVATATSMLKLFADGADAVSLWQIQDLSWGKDTLGLIDLSGQPRPTVAALRTFLGLTGSATTVTSGSEDAGGLVSAAFSNPNSVVVVVANPQMQFRDVRATFTGAAPLHAITTTRIYSAAKGFAGAGELARLANGSLDLHLPPQSLIAVELRP